MRFIILPLIATATIVPLTLSQGFYPLQRDNLWQLEDADPMNYHLVESRVVADTTLPNGMVYTVLEGFGVAPAANYVRQDSGVVYAFDFYDSTEHVVYDFNAEIGDTIGMWIGDWIRLAAKGPVPFYGRTLMAWNFVFGIIAEITVIDSIGVTYLILDPGISFIFRGAVIDGVQYGSITHVEAEPAYQEAPTLLQNYPNPFNSVSNVDFSISKSSFVTIAVYDLLGREVATIVDERLAPGSYTRQWNAGGLASGVYLYRLTAGTYVETRKLVLIR
jgi:hypothetical protein